MRLHLAYHKEKTTVTVQNEAVEVKADQIIVWVSISLRSVLEWDAKVPRFPAILDVGNTHNFAFSQEQLQGWAGVHPDSLRLLKRMREKKNLVPVRAASLWLHGNNASDWTSMTASASMNRMALGSPSWDSVR
jgi:hypothetical protein